MILIIGVKPNDKVGVLPAELLYEGALSKQARRYFQNHEAGQVYYFSALHGLVTPTNLISGYDLSFNDPRRISNPSLAVQIAQTLNERELVFAGEYAAYKILQAVLFGGEVSYKTNYGLEWLLPVLAGASIAQQATTLENASEKAYWET